MIQYLHCVPITDEPTQLLSLTPVSAVPISDSVEDYVLDRRQQKRRPHFRRQQHRRLQDRRQFRFYYVYVMYL